MKQCSIRDCSDQAKKRGWCNFHYDRWRAHGDPLGGGRRKASPGTTAGCCVDGCGNRAVAWHYCTKHYSKWAKYGDPKAGWSQDGRSKRWQRNKDGYVFRFDPSSPHAGGNKLVYQHREVFGEFIGRPLTALESVHHRNGDRADNRLENLELWVRGQPAGQRVQDQVAWAREILRQYGDLVDRCF